MIAAAIFARHSAQSHDAIGRPDIGPNGRGDLVRAVLIPWSGLKDRLRQFCDVVKVGFRQTMLPPASQNSLNVLGAGRARVNDVFRIGDVREGFNGRAVAIDDVHSFAMITRFKRIQLFKDVGRARIDYTQNARPRRLKVRVNPAILPTHVERQPVIMQTYDSRGDGELKRRPDAGGNLIDPKIAAVGKVPDHARLPAMEISVRTLNDSSRLTPKIVVRATSAASRPRAIKMRPMRGVLLRASKANH